nr:MAG TPA: hypothetical protein [Bacteriophage sp.]
MVQKDLEKTHQNGSSPIPEIRESVSEIRESVSEIHTTIPYRDTNIEIHKDSAPPVVANATTGSPPEGVEVQEKSPYKEKTESPNSFLYGNNIKQDNLNSSLYDKNNLIQESNIKDSNISTLVLECEETPTTLKNKPEKKQKEKLPKATLEEALEKNPQYPKMVRELHKLISKPFFQDAGDAKAYTKYIQKIITAYSDVLSIPENKLAKYSPYIVGQTIEMVNYYITEQKQVKSFMGCINTCVRNSVKWDSFKKWAERTNFSDKPTQAETIQENYKKLWNFN